MLVVLEPVFAAKRALADLDARIAAVDGRIAEVGEDQDRLRKNLAALKGSAEERALARRYIGELNAQEDALGAMKREREALQAQRTAAAATLEDRIAHLQVG